MFGDRAIALIASPLLFAALGAADGKCQINVSRDGANADGCVNSKGKWVPYNDELCAKFDYTSAGAAVSYQGNFCTLDPILSCGPSVQESDSSFGVYENLQIVNAAQGVYDFVFYTAEWNTTNAGTVIADNDTDGEFETFLVMSYLT